MKILLVNYEYTVTGSTIALLRLAEHLRERGHQLSVCAVAPADGPIKGSYQERGFNLLDPPFDEGADLCICNTILTAPRLLELSGSHKTIWWIHEASYGLNYLLRNPNQIAAFSRASAVVFPIAHLRDAVYRSFIYDQDPGRFAVIPYGIPPVEEVPSAATEGEIRIVSVGSVYPRKRHADLIRAMALFSHPAAKCIIVGKFYALPDDCLSLIAGNPEKFQLAGELGHEATLSLIAGADIFCLPSESEVLPLTTLEAGILKKPMVLSDLPVYQDIWRHGRNCLLYPVGAIGMLAQSIAMLVGNPELRTRLGAAAGQTAAPYTDSAFFARFDALLDTL